MSDAADFVLGSTGMLAAPIGAVWAAMKRELRAYRTATRAQAA